MRRRPLLATTLLTLSLAAPALAGEDKGGGGSGGGGRLGQVSGGIGTATGGGGSRPPGGGGNGGVSCWTCTDDRYEGRRWRPVRRRVPAYAMVATGVAASVASVQDTPQRKDAKVELYAGVQKVFESDGAYSAELVVRDGRFRLAGAITHFFEPRAGGDGNLTLTMPSVTGGVRIDDGGRTKVFVEAGVVGAVTRNDPVMDSSITGVLGGVRLEHRIARKTRALFDAQRMFFSDDVRATALRAGVRLGFVQASFRVVDFNVGPALYGPELGVRF
jgi:hypothetical protein